MKKKKIFAALASLAIVASLAGVASQALAASGSSEGLMRFGLKGGERKGQPAELTEAQKAEMEAKLTAVRNAETAGDYDAWVTAMKTMGGDSLLLKEVTSEIQFQSYLAQAKEREAKRIEKQAKKEAVKTALTAGDYDAWVTAVKAMDENAPELNKITASNFAKYAEANKLMNQADSIFQELGIRGDMFGGYHDGPRGGRPEGVGKPMTGVAEGD